MISKNGMRKIVYNGSSYYWCVRVTDRSHRIHIFSEDKKTHIESPFFDTELPITPQTVREILDKQFRG